MTPRIKIRLFTVFSIVFLCIGLTLKPLQNDTFYIIKLGEDILNYGVDLIDHYSWVANFSYTYPHWLYDVLIYIIYFNFGFFGIYISRIVLYIILILSIYIINLRFNKSELMATISAIVVIPCLIGFVTARAQLVTAILFLWQVYFIEKLISSGKKKYVFFLLIISFLVANMHATIWPFYFILYLPFIGEHLVSKFLNWKKITLGKKIIVNKVENFRLLLIAVLLGFFMGFLSPSKICFTYIFNVMQGSSQNYIIEHFPMVLINNVPFLIFLVILLFILIFSDTKIKMTEFFMLGGLILMSLSSVRHSAFFYIIGFLYLSILCNRYLKEKKDNTLEILFYLFVKNKLIYIFSLIFIVCISYYKFQDNFSYEYVSYKDYPVKAVEFIKTNLDLAHMNLYNGYGFGSFLLFNDIPVFIDSRCDLYLKEFNGMNYSVFDDAMEISNNYEEKFEFYDVKHVLISKKDILFKVLHNDQNYDLIYEDDNFVLFKRCFCES